MLDGFDGALLDPGPASEQPRIDVLRPLVEQVDLADRDVDGRSTIGINGLRLRLGERSCGRGCPVFGVELPESSD